MNRTRANTRIVATTPGFAAFLFVACGGSSGASASSRPERADATTSTRPAVRDVEPTAADFVNINTMTRVGDHFVGSLNGHLDAALAVARNPNGGDYPVGTVIQLIPTEAMVKRHAGYSPPTGDWQFFSPRVSPEGDGDRELGPGREELFRLRLRRLPPPRRRAVRLRLRQEPRLRAAPAA